MISHRFLCAVSLLTVTLFLFSASVNKTLHQLENSPAQSQLAIYSPTGQLQGLYHGDLAQLRAAALNRPPGMMHRLRTTADDRWL